MNTKKRIEKLESLLNMDDPLSNMSDEELDAKIRQLAAEIILSGESLPEGYFEIQESMKQRKEIGGK